MRCDLFILLLLLNESYDALVRFMQFRCCLEWKFICAETQLAMPNHIPLYGCLEHTSFLLFLFVHQIQYENINNSIVKQNETLKIDWLIDWLGKKTIL